MPIRRETPATLQHFESDDGLRLAGLLFEPRRHSGASAVIWLHGNGDSSIFTSPRTAIVARELVRRGIAFFPFDNRGAHMLKRFRRRGRAGEDRVEVGMARERILDAVPDIRGAIRHLRGRGYRNIHLAGHSSGANKICVFHSQVARSGIRSNILVAGGDDAGLYREQLGKSRYAGTLERARREIDRGSGERMIPAGISHFPLSWSALLDTIDPDGSYNVFPFREVLTGERWSRRPLFGMFRALRQPTLAIYGSDDEYCFGDVEGCVRVLDEHRPKKFEATIVEGADHGFSGLGDVLGCEIADWVTRVDAGKK